MSVLTAVLLVIVLIGGGSAIATAAPGELYGLIEPDETLSFTNVPTDSRFQELRILPEPEKTPLQKLTRALGTMPAQLDGTILRHSREHQLDPELVRAVIMAESNFNPSAISKSGAIGLMQLMPRTATSLSVHDPFDPEENIAGGVRYLRYLLDRFGGDLTLALAAYNAGLARVQAHRALPPIQETRRYVHKVLKLYRMLTGSSFGSGFRSFTPTVPVLWPEAPPQAPSPR